MEQIKRSDVKKEQPTTPRHVCDNEDCPSCGSRMTKSQFRSGSVQHPTANVDVCTSCGTRK